VTKQIRLYLILGVAALVLLGGGAFVGIRLLTDKVNEAIPQADLLGAQSSPSGSAPATPGQPTPSPTPPPGSDIKGPLNILIVGIDTRVSVKDWVPHADAVMIMHVNADHTQSWITSLPRDLVVNIPAFQPAGFGGGRTKLTHAMSYGSRIPGSTQVNNAQGFQLVAKTVSAYTGIQQFDAAALLSFNGLTWLVDSVGGIDINIDMDVSSIHRAPTGKYRPTCGGCEHGYSGPQAQYKKGMMHLVGWQALDYSRQRYIAGGDYARARHQRQVVQATIAKAFKTAYMTDFAAIDNTLKSFAGAFVFDGRGQTPMAFGYALRNLRPESVTQVGLPGSGAYSGGTYIGENLNGIQSSYFAALRQDNLGQFLVANPSLTGASAG